MGDATSTIAMTIEQHQLIMLIFLSMSLPVLVNILRMGMLIHPMVLIGYDLRSINADPVEQRMRKGIGIIPAQFGRHKIINARLLKQLRQRSAIAKGIRQPLNCGAFTEFLHIETLAIQHLAHQ